MLRICLLDQIRIIEGLIIIDIGKRISSLKCQWAGHITRRRNGRWCRKSLEWRPWIGKRTVGRPTAG